MIRESFEKDGQVVDKWKHTSGKGEWVSASLEDSKMYLHKKNPEEDLLVLAQYKGVKAPNQERFGLIIKKSGKYILLDHKFKTRAKAEEAASTLGLVTSWVLVVDIDPKWKPAAKLVVAEDDPEAWARDNYEGVSARPAAVEDLPWRHWSEDLPK